MSKPKGGLQKKVSSIFDGVPLESEAARGDIRRPENPTGPAPAAHVAAPRPAPVAVPPVTPAVTAPPAALSVPPIQPAVQPQMPKAPAPASAAPTAWPKAPAVKPEPPRPQVEQKPKVSLAAALASETAAPTPPVVPPRPAPAARQEAPARPHTPPSERPAPSPRAMPKVIVKQSAATEKRKTIMLIGGLSVVLVMAVLWSTGLLSGSGAGTTPVTLSSEQSVPVTPTKIQWQRPLAPPPARNPMRLGSFGGSTSAVVPVDPKALTGNPATSFNVTAVYISRDSVAALVDGRSVRVGDIHRGARILTITKDYVEYELDGRTKKEYVHGGNYETGSTEVMPDANSQSLK
jgi:hypothetical protein